LGASPSIPNDPKYRKKKQIAALIANILMVSKSGVAGKNHSATQPIARPAMDVNSRPAPLSI
jgi:hypothetical protein